MSTNAGGNAIPAAVIGVIKGPETQKLEAFAADIDEVYKKHGLALISLPEGMAVTGYHTEALSDILCAARYFAK